MVQVDAVQLKRAIQVVLERYLGQLAQEVMAELAPSEVTPSRFEFYDVDGKQHVFMRTKRGGYVCFFEEAGSPPLAQVSYSDGRYGLGIEWQGSDIEWLGQWSSNPEDVCRRGLELYLAGVEYSQAS